ncbi:hypothetical protein EV361DRAFT_874350, partial [Lentinula raphanica]
MRLMLSSMMNNEQQPQTYSLGFQNSHESSSHELLSEPSPPSMSEIPVSSADNASNTFPNLDTFSDGYAYRYGENLEGERRVGSASVLNREFNERPPEINEEMNMNEITLLLTLVLRAQDGPRIVYTLDLQSPVVSNGGVPTINAVTAVLLANSLEARLPEEFRLSLNHAETTLATAGIPPYLLVPVESLPDYRQLASVYEVLMSDPSTFVLYPASDYFIPDSMLAKPSKASFVLIVQPPTSLTGLSDTVDHVSPDWTMHSEPTSSSNEFSPAPSGPQVQSDWTMRSEPTTSSNEFSPAPSGPQ